MSEDTELVLEVVGELVQATETENNVPQLPQDLNTTNNIITNTLDLLFSDLEMNIQQNDTNATSVEVGDIISNIFGRNVSFLMIFRAQLLFLKLWTTYYPRVTRQV